MKFLTVSTGESATTAVPLFATSDPSVIAAALEALFERAGIRAADDDPDRTAEASEEAVS